MLVGRANALEGAISSSMGGSPGRAEPPQLPRCFPDSGRFAASCVPRIASQLVQPPHRRRLAPTRRGRAGESAEFPGEVRGSCREGADRVDVQANRRCRPTPKRRLEAAVLPI